MSRIGKSPIKVPGGVTVGLNGSVLQVKGPKGELTRETYGRVQIAQSGDSLQVDMAGDAKSSHWGLYRTLLSNMVLGVSQGFRRELELVGTGYRAAVQGKALNVTVGLSHQVLVDPPAGIAFEVDKTGKIVVSGADKELVGRIASEIRSIRPPEPYHGKGIRYSGERIVQKVGKAAGKK
jgi:large subunit ribosomal protein L6